MTKHKKSGRSVLFFQNSSLLSSISRSQVCLQKRSKFSRRLKLASKCRQSSYKMSKFGELLFALGQIFLMVEAAYCNIVFFRHHTSKHKTRNWCLSCIFFFWKNTTCIFSLIQKLNSNFWNIKNFSFFKVFQMNSL